MLKRNRISWGSPDYLNRAQAELQPQAPIEEPPERQVIQRNKPVTIKQQIDPDKRRKSKFQKDR